jgi:hypothetical protein
MSKMDSKLKKARDKGPPYESPAETSKLATANEIAQKLIDSKQNSEIARKETLVP